MVQNNPGSIDKLVFCTQEKQSAWIPDLVSRGYGEPLPAPAPAVQATLATIAAPEIHKYIQDIDTTALQDVDEDGEHAPLLLTTLDLSHWTGIMIAAITETKKGLGRLQEAQKVLGQLLENDEHVLQEALRNTRIVENALRSVNPHEDWSDLPPPTDLATATVDSPSLHPLLDKLNIAPAHKAAIEDFSESISSTQSERDLASLDAIGKGPAIPFLPSRAVEEQLASRSHRTWCLKNINLLAPISIPMWKIWADISDAEATACEEKAISCVGMFKEPQELVNAFPIALYDHHKCTTTTIKVHAKQDVLTCAPRHPKYTSQLWNCQRPYIRCTCNQNAKVGCKGNMLWFDHSVWYMVNNLPVFFPDSIYPSMPSKFGAFLTWMKGAARVAVRTHITFMAVRQLMQVAAIEFATDPAQKILSKYYDAPGARKIERLFKPAAFSTEATPTPPPKRRRLNMNVSPGEVHTPQTRPPVSGRGRYGRGRGRGSSYAAGRGSNSNDYRTPGGFQIFSNSRRDTHGPASSGHAGQAGAANSNDQSRQDRTSSSNQSVVIKPWSPIKGRVLNWDDAI